MENLDQVLSVRLLTFNTDEQAELIRKLLADHSAEPLLSLLGLLDDQPVGHIQLTNAVFSPPSAVYGSILAPLQQCLHIMEKRLVGG